MSHSFFLPYPITWTHPSSCNTTLGAGVLSSIGGATLKKAVGGGNPTSGDRSPWGFSKLFQPRCSTSFGCSRHSFTAGGPPGTWGCGPMHKTGSPGPWGRAHWLAHPPQLRQPRDSPSLGNKSAWASGMCQGPRSPKPEGNRADIHFLELVFIGI